MSPARLARLEAEVEALREQLAGTVTALDTVLAVLEALSVRVALMRREEARP